MFKLPNYFKESFRMYVPTIELHTPFASNSINAHWKGSFFLILVPQQKFQKQVTLRKHITQATRKAVLIIFDYEAEWHYGKCTVKQVVISR